MQNVRSRQGLAAEELARHGTNVLGHDVRRSCLQGNHVGAVMYGRRQGTTLCVSASVQRMQARPPRCVVVCWGLASSCQPATSVTWPGGWEPEAVSTSKWRDQWPGGQAFCTGQASKQRPKAVTFSPLRCCKLTHYVQVQQLRGGCLSRLPAAHSGYTCLACCMFHGPASFTAHRAPSLPCCCQHIYHEKPGRHKQHHRHCQRCSKQRSNVCS